MARDEDWWYVTHPGKLEELFNIARDRDQTRSMARSHPRQLDHMVETDPLEGYDEALREAVSLSCERVHFVSEPAILACLVVELGKEKG